MAVRMRIAAAACVVLSGLFVGGAGAALAFAGPDAGQTGETGDTETAPTGGVTTAPTAGDTPVVGPIAGPPAAATPTASTPKPTPQIGDGRNGQPSDVVDGTPSPAPSSKQTTVDRRASPQTGAPVAGEPNPAISTRLAEPGPTTDPTVTVTPEAGPTGEYPPPDKEDPDDPDEHQNWHWPWCWPGPPAPGPPPGASLPGAGTGNGGGGGVSTGKPPIGIGIPKPPPLMQLPVPTLPEVVPPTLPVISVDPAVDVVTGLATAAAELPFAPLTLPAIVPPIGAGGIGAGGGGPGAAPRPGTPPAPRNSGGSPNVNQPPKAGGQNPPAFGASNGAMPASYRAGYGDYLRTAGVGQMAAVAIPGVTGILVLTGAGGLVGYRQARAGHIIRSSGTARFIG